jgi:hypothetical protein
MEKKGNRRSFGFAQDDSFVIVLIMKRKRGAEAPLHL